MVKHAHFFDDDTWDALLKKTQDHIVGRADIEKHAIPAKIDVDNVTVARLKQLLEKYGIGMNKLFEVGCSICLDRSGEKFVLAGCATSRTPGSCRIYDRCDTVSHGPRFRLKGGKMTHARGKPSLENIGTFHTHPVGPAFPSAADLQCHKNANVFVIGGREGNDVVVRAFAPKNVATPSVSLGKLESKLNRERAFGAAGDEKLMYPLSGARTIITKDVNKSAYVVIPVPRNDEMDRWVTNWLKLASRWFYIGERRAPLRK